MSSPFYSASMSPSMLQSRPPPRRKSCEACRAAKRRCDLALPTCSRCSQRNLSCFYPGLPSPELIPEMLSIMQEGNSAMPPGAAGYTPLPIPSLALEPTYINPQSEDSPMASIQEYETNFAITLTKSIAPLPPGMPSRLHYAIDRLKDVPRMMVMENQTPWCHPRLYADGMPKVMQDAFSCCALYLAKTPINTPIITSLIESRLQELLLAHQQQPPTSHRDILAYNQALILYQIMRLFDPTIHTNPALDDPILSTLRSTAISLFNSTHFPISSLDPSSLPNPISLDSITRFWTLWILEESARRTILATFFFIQIFKVLRGDRDLTCDGKLGLIHSWYLSAHLWNAASAFEFSVAWAEKEHFVIDNVNFSGALQAAQPSDFDSFGRMLLVSAVGFDQAKSWFGVRGVILEG